MSLAWGEDQGFLRGGMIGRDYRLCLVFYVLDHFLEHVMR